MGISDIFFLFKEGSCGVRDYALRIPRTSIFGVRSILLDVQTRVLKERLAIYNPIGRIR